MHKSRCTRGTDKCINTTKLCAHGKRMNNCLDCHRTPTTSGEANVYLGPTSEICVHLKARKLCSLCGGSHLCITCGLTGTKIKQTECSPCRRFRDNKAPLKQKESALKKHLDTAIETGSIPSYTSHDKAIAVGLDPTCYGSTRPDFVWVLPDRFVIVECDENQHAGMQYSCERRRELQICNVAGKLPVVFIRFNPDTFSTGSKSARIKLVSDTIANRHAVVVDAIKNAVQQVNPMGLTFTKLFFDCECVGDGGTHACNFVHTSYYSDHEAFLMTFQ
jgi:hypothetical protein